MATKQAGVVDQMERLNLTEAERTKVVVEDGAEEEAAAQWAVAGKVLHDRVLHVNTISDALKPAWSNPRGLAFRSIEDNMSMAVLGSKHDLDWVWEGSPWWWENMVWLLRSLLILFGPLI
jgi:hypothetical protein